MRTEKDIFLYFFSKASAGNKSSAVLDLMTDTMNGKRAKTTQPTGFQLKTLLFPEATITHL